MPFKTQPRSSFCKFGIFLVKFCCTPNSCSGYRVWFYVRATTTFPKVLSALFRIVMEEVCLYIQHAAVPNNNILRLSQNLSSDRSLSEYRFFKLSRLAMWIFCSTQIASKQVLYILAHENCHHEPANS
jgi:hypothetical protein